MKKINTICNFFLIGIIVCTLALGILMLLVLSSFIKVQISYPEDVNYTTQIIIYSIFSVTSLVAMGFSIAVFILSNPRLFRRSTWTSLSEEWAKNKQERIAARAVKAEADKQKQIAELEQKLDELKKD